MNNEKAYLLMDYLRLLLTIDENGVDCKDKIEQVLDKLHESMGFYNFKNLTIDIKNIHPNTLPNDDAIDEIIESLKKHNYDKKPIKSKSSDIGGSVFDKFE